MTAEEIREIAKRATEPGYDSDEVPEVMMCEIAAQLAELNANLRLIFHVPKPELYNPGSPGPRLTIDKLD